MSASSNCVTCGMLTQLACRRGPEIFWMRDSGLSFDWTERREVDDGIVRAGPTPARAAAPPAPAARRHGERLLHECLHVVVRDARLEACACDSSEIDAELAREASHRRAGVGAREAGFVDRGEIGAAAGDRLPRPALQAAAAEAPAACARWAAAALLLRRRRARRCCSTQAGAGGSAGRGRSDAACGSRRRTCTGGAACRAGSACRPLRRAHLAAPRPEHRRRGRHACAAAHLRVPRAPSRPHRPAKPCRPWRRAPSR